MKLVADFHRTASTSGTLGTWSADATRPRRILFHDFMFGSEATPADAAILWSVRRSTAAGTSTAVVVGYLDPGDSASESDAGENHTIEPTYSSTDGFTMLSVALNQRATFRWVAAPGMEIVVPQTASNGIGIETDTISTGTPVISATVHCLEM